MVRDCSAGVIYSVYAVSADLSSRRQATNHAIHYIYAMSFEARKLSMFQVLACGAAIVTLSMGIRHGFGLWLQPITQEMGWTRQSFALAMAVQNLSWGVVGIFAGMAADRFGAFRVLMGKKATHFDEDLLISHKGLTGPAILQISNYWSAGDSIMVDLCADVDLESALCSGKAGSKIQLDTALAQLAPNLPKRLQAHCFEQATFAPFAKHKWADVPDKVLKQLAANINAWTLLPSGSEGYKKAEVTRGGVAVSEVNNQTMESRLHKGLYFVGEVLDVTGWLGGYNFQWAWASGVAAGRAVSV